MEKFNLKEGPIIGQTLKKIEKQWIENKFHISEEKISKIVKN